MSILDNLNLFQLIGVLILSLVPTLLLLTLVLYADRKDREPTHLIIICMLSGLFTISLSILLGKILVPSLDVFKDGVFNTEQFSVFKIGVLALIEEVSKFIVLYFFMAHNKKFDELFDGFVYSSIIALSFASIETLMYVFNEATYQDMTSLAVLRNFTTIPLHLVCGISMGYYVAIERFSKSNNYKIRKLFKAIMIPTFIHTVYNSFFSLTLNSLNSKPYSLLIIILFLVSVYVIGIDYLERTVKINKMYEKDEGYTNYYKNLMTKTEFLTKQVKKEVKEIKEIEDDFIPYLN